MNPTESKEPFTSSVITVMPPGTAQNFQIIFSYPNIHMSQKKIQNRYLQKYRGTQSTWESLQ